MLDLISANRGKFLSLQRPYIDSGVSLNTSADNTFLSLRDVDAALVTFKDISAKLSNLSEVDSAFSSSELEINYGLLEI